MAISLAKATLPKRVPSPAEKRSRVWGGKTAAHLRRQVFIERLCAEEGIVPFKPEPEMNKGDHHVR